MNTSKKTKSIYLSINAMNEEESHTLDYIVVDELVSHLNEECVAPEGRVSVSCVCVWKT